ncbi:MAG: exodeoxyribonuclease VII large subunit [Patescibacteria group bacterium]|nr:exodeoxyribonuclease VII large subunit [Patescibacteria group bacterium]
MQLDLLKENGEDSKTLTVSEYIDHINQLVSLETVLVEGEVSNFRDIPGRNFCYFDIKDDKVSAKCFQGFWHSKKVDFLNGTTIKVLGHPNLQRNGSLVIDVREVFLLGEGELMRAYLKLKEELQKEGLFDENMKKELPLFPKTVGLIAGKKSSAYHDVIAELSERWGGADIFFHSSKVQGPSAKNEIISAIRRFNQKMPVDVLIVARGGGSMEDLQAFDSEDVVREIFASKIPIISAIGHEDHWTLSDFVSDVRAKTPTKAAQVAVPDRNEIFQRLDYFSERTSSILDHMVKEKSSKLVNLETILVSNFERIFQERKVALDDFQRSASVQLKKLIQEKTSTLENFENLLKALNPKNVLRRGYGIVEKNGKRIVNLSQVEPGDEVKTVLHDGSFTGKIQKVIR